MVSSGPDHRLESGMSESKILRTLLILALALVSTIPMVPSRAQAERPLKVLLFTLRYLGPDDHAFLAGEVGDAVARHIQAGGHQLTKVDKPAPSPGQLLTFVKDFDADLAIYGTISLLGQVVRVDLRLASIKEGRLSLEAAAAQAPLGQRQMLLERVSNRISEALVRPMTVASVGVYGNKRVDTDAILAVVTTKKGAQYDPKTLAKDIKAIYGMDFFDDVQVDVEETPAGKRVTFLVREKPSIRKVLIKGNKKIKTDKISDVIDLKQYTIISDQRLKENVEKIKALYAQKGYLDAEVSVSVKRISTEAADVVLDITEGDQILIKKIEIEGNKAFPDDELKDLMEVTEKKPFWTPSLKNIMALFKGSAGALQWDALDRDLARIAAYYHNHGYIDAKVGRPRVRRKGKWLYVTIPVEEGSIYHVGSISIEENYFHDTSKLLEKLEIKKEKVYNQEVLRQDIVKLTDVYADEGFAYADIEPQMHKDPDKKLVDIVLKVDTGPKVSFERIEISGNTRTRDKVIRRELRVYELSPFSATGLRTSQKRLQRLGYFEEVKLNPTKGSAEDRMRLNVKVKERPTGTFSIGAGYSSVDKLMVMGEISQRNFLGKGQTVSFKGILGATTNRYSFSFYEPYFRDTKLSFGFDLYNWEREYEDYTRDSSGAAVRFGYPLTDNLSVFWGGRVDNTDLTDIYDYTSPVIRDSLDIKTTHSVNMGLSYDSRDDYYFPTEGWVNSASIEYAGGPLGGDSAFVKIQGATSYYHPIWRSLVGHVKIGAGWVTEGSGGKLPIFEKFFIGGIDTVRGYKYGNISPIDPNTGDRIGGEDMAYMQNEVIFPIVKDMGLHGVVFMDMGNVWPKEEFDLTELRKSVGMGIRWLSPMGPLRIEWGYNFDRQPGDDKSNFEFRMGGSF